MHRNGEHYADPTAGRALAGIEAAENEHIIARIKQLMKVIRPAAELAGVEIVGRIVFRDIETGREFK